MVLEERAHLPEEVEAAGVAVLLVGVGEVLADVAEASGAQQRVDRGVGEDVGVRVAGEAALRTLHLHSPQHEAPALGETVRVVADAGVRAQPSGSMRRSRRSNTAISVTPMSWSISTASSYL